MSCDANTVLQPDVPGSPGHLVKTPLNPNGQSELALLMREMTADLANVKSAITLPASAAQGTALLPKHQRIRCAWPTEPSDRNASFDALAVVYLKQVEQLDAQPGVSKTAYRNTISACRACHEASCPGPLAVIEKLDLPAD